jgi:hypothetical protein
MVPFLCVSNWRIQGKRIWFAEFFRASSSPAPGRISCFSRTHPWRWVRADLPQPDVVGSDFIVSVPDVPVPYPNQPGTLQLAAPTLAPYP